MLRHLIFRGAALNSRNRNQKTALMAAIQQGQAAAVDALIEAGEAPRVAIENPMEDFSMGKIIG